MSYEQELKSTEDNVLSFTSPMPPTSEIESGNELRSSSSDDDRDIVPPAPILKAQRHLRVFLSYDACDSSVAEKYNAALVEEGYFVEGSGRLVIDRERISYFENCHFFIIILSDDSVKSEMVVSQLQLALAA